VLARLLDATEGTIGSDGKTSPGGAARFARHPRRRELQVVFRSDRIAEPRQCCR
jgi:hypothetical protein